MHIYTHSAQHACAKFNLYVWLHDLLYDYLQSSLSFPLDLSYFSCQEVNLSLAVVNVNGSSQFTSPIPICVHGGTRNLDKLCHYICVDAATRLAQHELHVCLCGQMVFH